MKKVSLDIPSAFVKTWEKFMANKDDGVPLAEHIRRAIESYVEGRNEKVLFIEDQDGALVNLAAARYVIGSQHPEAPGCFVVMGELTPDQYKVLLRLAGRPVEGLVGGVEDISKLNRREFYKLLDKDPSLSPMHSVIHLDLSAAALKGFIEEKLGERVLDTREASAIGHARLTKKK